MKKKQVWSMILAAAVGAGMLAGCGSGQSGNESPAGTTGEKETTAAESSKSETEGENMDGWEPNGSADAPADVKIVIKDVFPDEEDVINLSKAISEKMAAHGQYVNVIFEEPPADSYKTAMPLAVMNGEVDADLIYFQGGDEAVAAQGLLEEWTPYLEKSKYLTSIMDESNVEKMKNYPYLLWLAPPRTYTPVMRGDWAEQLDSYQALEKDPSPDNYYALFKEIKDKGLAEYGITADGSTARLDSIFNHAFGVTGSCVQENGQWMFSKASQAEKAKLEYYAKLYADGLLDPDFLTNTWDVMEQKFYEGKAAVLAGTAGSVIQVYNTKMVSTNGEQSELVVLPPAKGESQSYTSIDVTKESRGFALNVDSKEKEAAVALLDFMASPEGRILDKVGVEGQQYEVKDNKIVFTDKFSGWWARFWDSNVNFDPQNPSLAEPIMCEPAEKSLEMVNQYMVMDKNILIPSEMTPQWDAMTNLYNEYSADIIRGVRPINDFDQFVEEWNQAGGNDFASILQEAFQ